MEPGILEERDVRSRSVEGKTYRMLRTAGGWQHDDASCDAWAVRGTCYHVEELNMENGETTRALAVIEELEDTAIVARISGQITADWVYRFPVKGQEVVGLSVDGVEAAARECAKLGEAIREADVRLEYEDQYEARFVAKAERYGVNSDGVEILLDVAIRAKRQPKFIRLRDGGTQFDEFWYEKGIAKAVRNAKEALLPERVKSQIMAEAEQAGKVRQVQRPRVQTDRSAGRTTPPPKPTPAEREAAGEEMMANFDQMLAAAKSLGYKDEGEVLAALEVKSRMDVGSIQEAFGKLRQLALAKKGNGK